MPTGLHVVEEVNANGVPVQPESVYRKAKTACGCLARQAVRIIHDDWRKVPEDDKNYIWNNWSKLFKLPEGTRDLVKSWVLKTANKSFKDWKSDLNLDYVHKGRSPFEKYGMITEEDWNAFVKKKSTDEAKLLSKQRSELAKKNIHLHIMGSSGYAASIPKWEKELEDAIIAGKQIPYANLDDRSKNWMLGRRSTSSSCAELSFNKPETIELVNKLAEIHAQVTQGSFVPDRENDVLTKALGTKEKGALALRCNGIRDLQMTFTSISPAGMQSRGGEKSSRQRSRKCTRRRRGKNERNKRT